ncbi:MAG: hypothetical protein K2X77_25665 [Candidatus Obscuribacterales bacterium]|jgi:hypothetical protein|nr:hypothetical protein [Candidatus Obscuribacterales bacterium]
MDKQSQEQDVSIEKNESRNTNAVAASEKFADEIYGRPNNSDATGKDRSGQSPDGEFLRSNPEPPETESPYSELKGKLNKEKEKSNSTDSGHDRSQPQLPEVEGPYSGTNNKLRKDKPSISEDPGHMRPEPKLKGDEPDEREYKLWQDPEDKDEPQEETDEPKDESDEEGILKTEPEEPAEEPFSKDAPRDDERVIEDNPFESIKYIDEHDSVSSNLGKLWIDDAEFFQNKSANNNLKRSTGKPAGPGRVLPSIQIRY